MGQPSEEDTPLTEPAEISLFKAEKYMQQKLLMRPLSVADILALAEPLLLPPM